MRLGIRWFGYVVMMMMGVKLWILMNSGDGKLREFAWVASVWNL